MIDLPGQLEPVNTNIIIVSVPRRPATRKPISSWVVTRAFVDDWFERLESSGFVAPVFLDALAEDVVWTATGHSPVAGTFCGKQAYIDGVYRVLNDRLQRWRRHE